METVQLYVHERYAPVAIPVKQLKGFKRVALNPGETKTVTMKLTPEDLMLLDRDMHWTVVQGTFDLMVGKSSGDIVLSQPLQVQVASPLKSHGLSIDVSPNSVNGERHCQRRHLERSNRLPCDQKFIEWGIDVESTYRL